MPNHKNTICLRNVEFQIINQKTFDTVNIEDIKYFFISASGLIDTPGNTYIFTSDGAFFMSKSGYSNDFINRFLIIFGKKQWQKLNLFFCDFLFIAPEIYDSFVRELCARNIRDFWFETMIDIFRDKVCK